MEETKSTVIPTKDVYVKLRQDYHLPEITDKLVVDSCLNNESLVFDKETKTITTSRQYNKEKSIYDFVEDKLSNPSDITVEDIDKYKKSKDGFELTEEQFDLIDKAVKNKIVLLTGYAGCVDKDTEFFNGKEWKPISEYNKNDRVLQYTEDRKGELVYPNKYIKLPCDEFYHFETSKGINQTLSDDHILTFDTYTGKKNKIHKLVDIPMKEWVKSVKNNTFKSYKTKFITTFNYSGKGIDLTDVEIELMCAIICDGSLYNNGQSCRFNIKKERKKEKLRDIFKRLDSSYIYKETKSSVNGYSRFYLNKVPRREKEFTPYWYNCNKHQLKVIINNILQWDGSIYNNRKTFSTTNKNTCDFIQFAYASCGIRSTIYTIDRRGQFRGGYERKSIEYTLVISSQNPLISISTPKNSKDNFTEIKKVKSLDGFKYCFSVPSGRLILRRKGKIFITHNCGKSSSLANLLDLYDDAGLSYTLLAPTGSAAVVLEESTHRKASTAHLKCLTGTITSDILILDEMSMFDIDTLYMVVNSIENPDIRVVLSGDDKQLAPVGLGCVFADLLTWEAIPKVSLSKPFRYGKNGISTVATNTRNQEYTEETDKLQHYKRYIIDGNNINRCKTSMLSCYLSVLKHCEIKDLIGITGYNVGELGVEELNKCIQAEINPPQPTKKEVVINDVVYRVGDRVVNTQNDYHALSYDAYKELKNDTTNQLTTSDVADETITNGMRGTIVNIYDKNAIVVLFDIGEKLIVYSPDKYNNLSLAYVINFHKSQGAGIKNVICLITPLHKRVLSRNLLYVGQTRAKENLIEILDEPTYRKALSIDALSSRKTNLQLFLAKKN